MQFSLFLRVRNQFVLQIMHLDAERRLYFYKERGIYILSILPFCHETKEDEG